MVKHRLPTKAVDSQNSNKNKSFMRSTAAPAAPAIEKGESSTQTSRHARLKEAEDNIGLLNKEKHDNLTTFIGIILRYILWNIALMVFLLGPCSCIWCNRVPRLDLDVDVILVILMVSMYGSGWVGVNLMFHQLVRLTMSIVRSTRRRRIFQIRSLINQLDVATPIENSTMPLEEYFRTRKFEIEHEIYESDLLYKNNERVILVLCSIVVAVMLMVAVAIMVLIVNGGRDMTAKGPIEKSIPFVYWIFFVLFA